MSTQPSTPFVIASAMRRLAAQGRWTGIDLG
jgi:hypothetical protein